MVGRLRIGCQTYTWEMLGADWSGTPDDIIAAVAAAGYDGVEFANAMIGDYLRASDRFATALDRHGWACPGRGDVHHQNADDNTPRHRGARLRGAMFPGKHRPVRASRMVANRRNASGISVFEHSPMETNSAVGSRSATGIKGFGRDGLLREASRRGRASCVKFVPMRYVWPAANRAKSSTTPTCRPSRTAPSGINSSNDIHDSSKSSHWPASQTRFASGLRISWQTWHHGRS